MKGDGDYKRKTKKDKARRNVEYNGQYSAKHVRIQEELMEKSEQINQTVKVDNQDNTINNKKDKLKK
tara:strand:+ start:708 stop:908 length:201 start_codon:yes stop_codon:yes gene_type:complete